MARGRRGLSSDGVPTIQAWDRTSSSALPKIGHRELRDSLGPLLGQVCASSGAMEVLNGGHQEVVVVAQTVFDDLVETARGADKLREAMSYLLAAAQAGVHIPSETMDKLGLTPAQIDPEATKAFRSRYPLTPTHGVDGEPLTAVPVSAVAAFEEDEDELVFVEQPV